MTGILNLLMGASSRPSDSYFEYTTLLLPGNGTNGAQNNTFLDGSTNNFTITRNGNTTQGTFSPFSQTGWGNYFSTAFLTTSATQIIPATGDFTIEAMVYVLSLSSNPAVCAQGTTGTSGRTLLYINSSGNLVFFTTSATNTSTTTVSTNAWNYIAVTRTGSSVAFYINGNPSGTGTNAATIENTTLKIGRYWNTDQDFAGYISNLRISTVVRSISTPTTFYSPDSDTKLLTCVSNRFVDLSNNSYALSIGAGSPSVQAFSPFNPTASWSAATNGGSGYFDGSGDYLSVADNTNLRFGNNAFTIQAWVYRNASGAAHSIIAKGGASTGYVLQVTSTNVLRFTHGTTNVDTTTTIPAFAWTHVAAVRTNTSTNGFQLYINGVSSATATVATDFNQTDTLYIGSDRSAANVMNGYISGLKYTNGTAESISVPTGPPTATTNVALLTNFTNAGIYDATSKNDLETVGNAQISTAQSKFGGSSIYVDGTGDYLMAKSQPFLNPGSSNFTIEAWVNFSAAVSSTLYVIVAKTTSGTNNSSFTFVRSTANKLAFAFWSDGTGGNYVIIATTANFPSSTGVWNHVAVTRSGSTFYLFIDGVSQTITTSLNGTATLSSPIFASETPITVGASADPNNFLNGYVQDVRITNYARYTGNFTAPTAAFPTL
jgi:Concanavalin A-like lectin/glucanases superfamily